MPVRPQISTTRQMILLAAVTVVSLTLGPSSIAAPSASSPQAQVTQAKLEMQKGHLDKAIQLLRTAKQVLGTAPGSCDCHYNLGKALCAKAKQECAANANKAAGDFVDAKKELRTAIRVGKGNVVARQANQYLMSELPKQYLTPRVGEGTEMIMSRLGLRGTDRGAKDLYPKAKVFEFYADWCEPCKMLKPVMAKIKEQYGDQVEVMSINVDDKNNADIIEQYDVSPIPTVIYMNTDGQVVGYSIGFEGEKNMQKELQKIIPSAGAKGT